MAKVLQPLRFFCILLIIISFFPVNGFVWLIVRDRWKRTYVWSRILSVWCRIVLLVLGGRTNVIGRENLESQPNFLLAGNHLSYMDVMFISSTVTSCFVTSVEIKETPGLGHLCQMAGCLFVERRSRASLTKEIGELQEGLERGLTVAIFPEATSTNGEQILRFRRPLFLSAVQAKKAVLPMCLNYRKLGGVELSIKNRDSIFWYGDMPFVPHLWALCGMGSLEMDLHFLKPIQPVVDEDPGEVAARAQAAVESVFRPVKS